MRKIVSLLFAVTLAGSATIHAQQTTALFNGKNLDNWEIFIGTALKGFEDLKATATPENVYSIVEIDGKKVLHISGTVNASIATKESFENYHLRLEYKWGEKVYTARNSGLLYHSYGSFGSALGTWMNAFECQLKTGSNGDAFTMGTTYFEARVQEQDKNNIYAPTGSTMSFGNDQNGGKMARKLEDAELPAGEWNVIDLYCLGSKSIHVVNGVKVMECENTGQLVDGKIMPLTKGKIQIQSEGGELFVRKVEIEGISAFPGSL
jgi:hypothetical protein